MGHEPSATDFPFLANSLKRRLRDGELSMCLRVALARTPEIAFAARAAGFDALYVDLEHSTISLAEAGNICASATGIGMPSLVRLRDVNDASASILLEAGCKGIIAPHVRGVEDARAAVRMCKYPPQGERSAGGPSLHTGFTALEFQENTRLVNDSVLVAVMIETGSALAQLDRIAALDGLDMLFVGTSDLSAELGIPGEFAHSRIKDAYRAVAAACRTHGKAFGIGGIGDAQLIAEYIGMGARFVSAATDLGLIISGGGERVRQLRGPTPANPPRGGIAPTAATHNR